MITVVIGSVGEDGKKYSLVGATGTNYGSTQALEVMDYHEAMKTINKLDWLKAICVEHEKIEKYNNVSKTYIRMINPLQ